MGVRFNRLHFYQRFDITRDFVAIKVFETSGRKFAPGDPFDKTLMTPHKVQAMFNSRKITYAEALHNPANLVAIVEERIAITPEVKKGAFGWLTVLVDGKQIGGKVRTMPEAQAIIDEWNNTSH